VQIAEKRAAVVQPANDICVEKSDETLGFVAIRSHLLGHVATFGQKGSADPPTPVGDWHLLYWTRLCIDGSAGAVLHDAKTDYSMLMLQIRDFVIGAEGAVSFLGARENWRWGLA
jgi:hypothetical protein